ncbi:hypothetical protein F4808DRAFT_118499 [Astrocystis sublimbata]|nr:hypothetical protein F4808DRAFT_118499 [Astrocystis sublimbata]
MISSDTTLPTHPRAWRKACLACTKAKRHCSKELPLCRRCLGKRLPCTYPPPRRSEMFHPSSTALGNDPVTAPIDVMANLDEPEDSVFACSQIMEADFEGLALPTVEPSSGASAPASLSSDLSVGLADFWFLAPESWTTEPAEQPTALSRDIERALKQYIKEVQSWMRQWVTEGSSPLHHRELYSFHMPRHTQDAYTAMTMYMNRTDDTEATVHRILEDRVSQLLQDQEIEASLNLAGDGGMSIFNRLSRVQSLLCYQLIRLYDGDIRMRAQAEALIPTLSSWNTQMLETARDSLGHPERFLAPSPFEATMRTDISNPTVRAFSSPNAVWQAWVVAESVRRAWQTTNFVQDVYQFLRCGWAHCSGHLPSTLRKSLWHAPSAYSWTKELNGGKDPLLLSLVRVEEVFTQIQAEIDEFNMVTINIQGMEDVM